ncbi:MULTISPECIES: folate-binding protein YgfZ [unclassified Crossiella]|uniref:CAF17-like 4Fe-4S cluster assembly/insertion protein YgfZ n=1 Tax=unclassified Crossiella TaxID=2620835 RepID=UPI001FFEE368|nr:MULTISPECIES: folate-binding protein YgfZ [unclassified Crossiella]MCK2236556.1 folate-binding protein YgfZ [Crossiella sp. S99.2]MCK2250223.1 folate-binding protein YgfZ [Crossiella sp. S99.1]
MSSPLLGRPGAIPAPEGSPDLGVPWHFGDPPAEARTAARRAAVVDRSHRVIIAVPGADRLDWLHSLTSQHFHQLAPGTGGEALVLDAQGRVEHHMLVAHHGETIYLDTEAETAPALLSYLTKMVFWSKVEPKDVSAEFALLTVLGPDTAEVLAKAGAEVPDVAYGLSELPGGGFVRRMPWPTLDVVDLLVPHAELITWFQRLADAGARPTGTLAYEALRVEALRPRLGQDTDNRTIPQEVNWIGVAVHLDKGCYRGQETVARVHNLGRPPRRMVLLHLDGSADAVPETGDPVQLDGRVVGRLGSVVMHHELGPIGLALLKQSVPVDAQLLAGAEDRVVAATVDPDSVPAPTGEPPGKAALRRLRG